MKTKDNIRFSKKSLDFLAKAGKQKSENWLERNQSEYEKLLKTPFISLAEKLKRELRPLAPDYHFPTKGLGRIKRPAFKVAGGQDLYKDWVSLIATRPSKSRFESHPHLFFGLFPNEDHQVLVAAGLWQPTSRQTRLIREAIAKDASPFSELFEDKTFNKRFKNGFCMDKVSTRTPRGFSETHEDIAWIKLKNFVVLKKISIRDFSSTKFGENIVADLKQGLRFNRLLDKALKLQWPP